MESKVPSPLTHLIGTFLRRARFAICCLCGFAAVVPALGRVWATEIFVGGEHDDFHVVSAGLAIARAGDIVVLRPGTYHEALRSVAPNVTLRGESGDQPVLITVPGTVLVVEHAGFSVENLIFDGQYGDGDTVMVRGNGDGFRMSRSEVRRSGQDCIDIGSQHNVRIEDSIVHHCLRTRKPNCAEQPCSQPPDCSSLECHKDAHGIAAGAVRNLHVVNTEIHTFSGDGLQVDADRLHPGWDEVVVDGCNIWLEPLPSAVAGYAIGIVPGENAIDTKTPNDIARPSRLTISNTMAHGFRDGLQRMSAFNLKENVEVDANGIKVSNSQIAFRIRGRNLKSPYSAQVTIANTVIYDVGTAIRYEEAIAKIKIHHTTIGRDVSRIFRNLASHRQPVVDAHNVLVLGVKLPRQLRAWNNLAVGSDAFINIKSDNYRLAPGSAAIDAGGKDFLPALIDDIEGNSRHWGPAPDIGAYEFSR